MGFERNMEGKGGIGSPICIFTILDWRTKSKHNQQLANMEVTNMQCQLHNVSHKDHNCQTVFSIQLKVWIISIVKESNLQCPTIELHCPMCCCTSSSHTQCSDKCIFKYTRARYTYVCRPDTSYLKGQGDFSLAKGTSMRNL